MPWLSYRWSAVSIATDVCMLGNVLLGASKRCRNARKRSEVLLAACVQVAREPRRVLGRNHRDHADAHVEGPQHLAALDASRAFQEAEQRRDRPAVGVDARREPGREDPGDVVGQPASGDVRQAAQLSLGERTGQRREIRAVLAQQAQESEERDSASEREAVKSAPRAAEERVTPFRRK